MFEQIINKRFKAEIKNIEFLNDYTPQGILNSKLDSFTKSFLSVEAVNIKNRTELEIFIDKAIRLQINYTIRPKWTILNYVFINKDSQLSEIIYSKISIFKFYRYYEEAINAYLKEANVLSVMRSRIKEIIDDTDSIIHDKLLTNPTAIKTKNFFLQVFKLKYPDITDINLESSIPFGYIRIFLEDKLFTGVLEKFSSIKNLDDTKEIDLKTIIKIINDKYINDDDFNALELGISFDDTFETIDYEYEPTGIESREEKIKQTFEIKEQTEYAITEEETEGSKIARLFRKDELESIIKRIFKNDKINMYKTFEVLENFSNWDDASDYLKKLFLENKVDIYNKDVVLFVDLLNSFYDKEKNSGLPAVE